MSNQPPNQLPTEPQTFRFGTRYMMAYTALCCIGFGILSASHQANHRKDAISATILEIVVVMVLLLGFAVVGLGPGAVRQSFQVVGKLCISFFVGGIVGILTMVYAAAQGATEHSLLLLLYAGWSGGFLITTVIAFHRSLQRLLKPS